MKVQTVLAPSEDIITQHIKWECVYTTTWNRGFFGGEKLAFLISNCQNSLIYNSHGLASVTCLLLLNMYNEYSICINYLFHLLHGIWLLTGKYGICKKCWMFFWRWFKYWHDQMISIFIRAIGPGRQESAVIWVINIGSNIFCRKVCNCYSKSLKFWLWTFTETVIMPGNNPST